MPSGFEIESGSNLSAEHEALAWKARDLLKERRNMGLTDPLLGRVICQTFNFSEKVMDDKVLCAVVNFLRQQHEPIGSGSRGYFYALNSKELEGNLNHLKDRMTGINRAVKGLEGCFSTGQLGLL